MTSKTRDQGGISTRGRRPSYTKAEGRTPCPRPGHLQGQREGHCCGEMEAPETRTARLRQRLLRALPRDHSRGSAGRVGSCSRRSRAAAADGVLLDMRERVRPRKTGAARAPSMTFLRFSQLAMATRHGFRRPVFARLSLYPCGTRTSEYQSGKVRRV